MKIFKFKRSQADPLLTASNPFFENVEPEVESPVEDSNDETETVTNSK